MKKTYRYLVLPMYRIGLRSRQRIQKQFGPAKNKYFYPLIAKPLIHIVVIVLIFTVTAANIQARTLPASTGENSVLFSLLGGEDLELIEETADQARNTTSTSYMDVSYGVSQRQIAANDVTLIPVADTALLVMTGGNAIATAPSMTGVVRDASRPRRRTDVEAYVVQSGDTISTIAASFDLNTTTLLWANNLGTRDFIKPGQELTILPVDGVRHTVARGDTLSKLAKNFDVEEADIIDYNNLDEDGILTIGEELLIPGGSPVRSAPTLLARTPTFTQVRDALTRPSPSPQQGSVSMIWPTSGRYITQYWGWKHTGVDIDGHYDSPIYASDSGVIEVAGWGTGYGIQAIINHQNGFKTRYAHMSKIFVTPGQQVSKGEVIGMVGTTGYSTGTHLHFEVYVNGVRANPLLYVR